MDLSLWQYVARWLQGTTAIFQLRGTCRSLHQIKVYKLPWWMRRTITNKRLGWVADGIKELDFHHYAFAFVHRRDCEDANNYQRPCLVDNEGLKQCQSLKRLMADNTCLTWFPRTLRYLYIGGRQDVTNEMLQNAFEQGHLEELDARDTSITWFPRTLRHLDVSRNQNVSYEMISHLNDLEWLIVSDTKIGLTKGTFPPNLQYLDATNCADVDDAAIENCRALTSLDASGTRITQFSPNLQYLNIQNRSDIDNEVIENCWALTSLNASGTRITQFPETLKELYICNRPDITEEMLAHLEDCEIIR